MRIVVTGGAGFIGSHLVDALVDQGHQVVVIDNFVTGRRENLRRHLDRKSIALIEHDISKPLFFAEPIQQIYHLASPASPIDYQRLPIPTLKVGALGTHNILGIARAHQCRVLLTSTSEVYGDPLVHPQVESYWGNVNPVGPRGCYDESKRFAEALMMAYHRQHRVDIRIARIFNTYGPRMRLDDGRVVPALISQALRREPMTVFGDGRQTRSFCYVSDMVAGLIALMEKGDHLPTNLGNPIELTIQQFAERIRELTGSNSAIEYRDLPADDPKRRQPDIGKAKALLGWQPQMSLADGLAATIAWAREVIA